MLCMISFLAYAAIDSYLQQTKTLDDFTYVAGEVYETQMIKHHVSRKNRPDVIEDVLVLRIGQSDEKFGFTHGTYSFQQLLGFNKVGKTIHIHYDPNAARIEEGVTLAIRNLKIGQANIIDFEANKPNLRIISIIASILTFVLILITVSIIKRARSGKLKPLI